MTNQSTISEHQPPHLYALVVRLIAEKDGTLRATVGHLAHAAFLDILRQVDPDVSQALHDLSGRKPFTLSPLHGFGHGRKGKLTIRAGQEGWLRLTLLDPGLFHTFIRYFLQGTNKPVIQLNQHTFRVSEILSTPGSHALAGHDSLAELEKRWAEADVDNKALHTIKFRFRTPTAFSLRGGRFRTMHVLPDPDLVFGELARYWDRLAGQDTREAVLACADDSVVVSRHKIKTHMVQFRRSKQVGFTGRVHYRLLDKDNGAMIRHCNRLADLAFYSGVGSKTTMGMGQVTRDKK